MTKFSLSLSGLLLATTAALVAYLVCSLAAIRLGVGPKLLPVYLLAALFSLWAIWGAGTEAMKWGAVLLVSGIPLYFLTKMRAGSSPAAEAGPAALPE